MLSTRTAPNRSRSSDARPAPGSFDPTTTWEALRQPAAAAEVAAPLAPVDRDAED